MKISPTKKLFQRQSSIANGTTWACACLVNIVLSGTAWAFFDAELDLGHRTGQWKRSGVSSKTLTSSNIQVAAHLDPIPLVPVSFGLRMASDTYNASIADHGLKSLTSTAVIPEIKAWLPLGDLKPFARIGYTALSTYKGTAEISVAGVTASGSEVFSSKGPRLALGLEWSLIPLISITGSVEHSTETISMTSGTIGGVDLKSTSKDIKYESNAFLIGAKVGI